MANNNFWIYSTTENQRRTAAELIAFPHNEYREAKLIKDIQVLEDIANEYSNSSIPENVFQEKLFHFAESFLNDSIRISIFFENYMKAELLIGGYLVHKITHTDEKYKEIKKEQKRRPIKLKELHNIEPFIIKEKEEFIGHEAISFLTLGFKELSTKQPYTEKYQFDSEVLNTIKYYNDFRNRLHFYNKMEFSLSVTMVENLRKIEKFVFKTIERLNQNK